LREGAELKVDAGGLSETEDEAIKEKVERVLCTRVREGVDARGKGK